MGGSESGKSFYRHGEAWYVKSAPLHHGEVDKVMIEVGGEVDALGVTWFAAPLPPKVHSFEIVLLDHPDYRAVLRLAAELARERADGNFSAEDFCAGLLELGFEDITARDRPDDLDPRLERLRLAVQDVADIDGMAYQDEEWWPEVVALHRKLSPLPARRLDRERSPHRGQD
jgi:hypothetical protein